MPSKTETSTTDAVLLDANVLIALHVRDHEHHAAARTWLGSARPFATTPSTQGSLVRFLVRVASTEHAVAAIETLTTNPRHQFWPDGAPYDARTLVGVVGPRHVTDAYLAAAARERGARLATFDRGLAALRPALVDLIA
jgi:toxin-antitoxin system PIN domain toxin